MRVMSEYRRAGFFWLPGKDEDKIPGMLTVSNCGRVSLEIVGNFGGEFSLGHESFELGRVVGHVENDGFVTLDGCQYSKKSISLGGISKSNIVARMLFSGAIWSEQDLFLFNTFEFSVDCLDEWVGVSGIKITRDSDFRTVTINYNPVEEISIELGAGLRLNICFAYSLPGFPIVTEAKISQWAYFKIISDELREIEYFTEIAYKITNLMCFAMDEIVAMKNVSVTSSEISQDFGDGKFHPVRISLFYKSIPFAEEIPRQNMHNMLFTYGAIKENIQQVFVSWLGAYEDLSPALNLYFSTKAGAQKYLEGKFLALAQGLETYHRRTSNETLMPPAEFESLVLEIKKGCPQKWLDWLSARLMHGNEVNLRKRIKQIIEPFKSHLGSSNDRDKLLTKIVSTRNYLTHYSEDLAHLSVSGRDLWLLCRKMEAIFNLHFLKVVGFTDKEIDTVVNNCHRLSSSLREC